MKTLIKFASISLTIYFIVNGIIDYNAGLNPKWWVFFLGWGCLFFEELSNLLERVLDDLKGN